MNLFAVLFGDQTVYDVAIHFNERMERMRFNSYEQFKKEVFLIVYEDVFKAYVESQEIHSFETEDTEGDVNKLWYITKEICDLINDL